MKDTMKSLKLFCALFLLQSAGTRGYFSSQGATNMMDDCPDECTCTGIEIDCSDGDIMSMTYFDSIQGANIVDLSSNQIEMIPEHFSWNGIEQLQYLYLNVNSIVYVSDDAFRTFINLEYLDLSNNFLESLPSRIVIENFRLRSLMLQGNLFGDNVPILHSDSLNHLDLSFCKLTHFGRIHLEHLPDLKTLNLRVNNLKYLSPWTFQHSVPLSLELSYNIWACNCSTVELFKWALVNPSLVDMRDFMCTTKNNIYIDLLNVTETFLFKETCDISETLFDSSTMKNLSLVRDKYNSTVNQGANGETRERLYDEAFVVFIITAIAVVVIAIFAGILIGLFFGRKFYTKTFNERHQLLTV